MSFLPREYSYRLGRQNSVILGIGITQARVDAEFYFWRQEVSEKSTGSVASMTESGLSSPHALGRPTAHNTPFPQHSALPPAHSTSVFLLLKSSGVVRWLCGKFWEPEVHTLSLWGQSPVNLGLTRMVTLCVQFHFFFRVYKGAWARMKASYSQRAETFKYNSVPFRTVPHLPSWEDLCMYVCVYVYVCMCPSIHLLIRSPTIYPSIYTSTSVFINLLSYSPQSVCQSIHSLVRVFI